MAAPSQGNLPKETRDQLDHQPSVESEYEDPQPEVQSQWNRDMTWMVAGLLVLFLVVIVYLIGR